MHDVVDNDYAEILDEEVWNVGDGEFYEFYKG